MNHKNPLVVFFTLLLFMLAVFVSSAARAQPVRPAGPLTQAEYLWYVASGNPNAEIRPQVLGPSNTGNFKYFVKPDGSLHAESYTPFRPSKGPGITLNVAQTVPKAQVAGAIGRFLAKSGGAIAGPLMLGIAAYDFAQEMGFLLENENGIWNAKKVDPTVCTVAPCYAYAVPLYGQMSNSVASGYKTSKVEACEAARASWEPVVPAQYKPVGVQVGATVCVVFSAQYGWTKLADHAITSGTVAPQSTNLSPATLQELADAIASESGWPTSSALARTFDDAMKSGETAQTENPILSGPSSSPGSSTTKTVNTTNNTTTTTTNTNNYHYDGPVIKVTNVTNTTVTNTTTGEPVSEETTEQDDQPEPEDSAQDTPLGEIPQLYEQKYPDGLEGVWAEQSAAFNATPLASLRTALMPNIGSSGSCPSWPMDLNLGPWQWSYGTHDFAPPCWVWDFGKVVILISALILARSLIFGG